MKVNGSLVFDASSASEIQNLRVQKLAGGSVPAWTSADTGRVIFVTTSEGAYSANTLYYGSAAASNWVALATGGNAAALQTEVDNIETTLGAAISSNGTFNAPGFTFPVAIGVPTSFTNALNLLAAYASGKDTLAELDDVTITGASNGQVLQYVGGDWINHTLVVADIPEVTASAAELNILDGATLSTAELNFVDGVTSAIQGQLDNKQALDAGLTSLSALAATGIIVQTADNVFAARTLSAPVEGLTITNPAGIAGNPTFALANDLAALEGLATTGYIVRTGDGTATTRALTGVAGNVVVTNGDGVASDTTINLAAITQANSGSFLKVTLDGFGRVTGNTAVTTADITGLVDATYINVTGDNMSGNLVMTSGATVTGLPTPVNANDAASKTYVDSLISGLTWEQPVDQMLADHTTATGVAVGDRIVNTTTNVIYTVTTDDTPGPIAFDAGEPLVDGAAFFNRVTDSGYTFNGTSLVQFTGTGSLNAGTGLALVGNTLNVNLGAGIAQLPSDEVGIDLFNASTGALILTSSGTDRSTDTGATLHLLTGGASGLAQSALGLYIAPAGVSNAMLANSSVGLNGDAGTSTLTLGQTLQVIGTSAQGVSTAVAGQTVTITVADATIGAKGVASFATADFDVTAGAVSIKANGVGNAQLENSMITVTGTTGTDTVSLGESFAINGDGAAISTAVTANAVAVSARLATNVLTGVASFAAADFVVTAGEVTAVAKGLDTLTDVTLTSPSAGQTLVHNGAGQFVNRKVYHLETVGSAATTWTVTHDLGQRYCVVTIVDATDEVVIPQSITFTSTTELVVTFNTAIAGKAVVMGIA